MKGLPPVLSGCRVLVTAQRRSTELCDALARRGAEVVVAPTLGVVSHIDEETLLARTRDILSTPVDTFVATTGVGFRGWVETAKAAGLEQDLLSVLAGVRLLARGPKALGAMQAAGLPAKWVAASETAAEVADLLVTEGVRGHRIAVQHHAAGDDGLDTRLTAAGAYVVPLVVYRWGPPPDPVAVRDSVRQAADGRFDAVVFTSAPGAAAWLDEVARLDATDAIRSYAAVGRLLVAAVGPVTSEPLVVAGMQPVTPDRPRMGALIRRIVTDLGHSDRGVRTPAGVLHLRASVASLDHMVLPVSPSDLAVLRRLAETPAQVVSREELLRGSGAHPRPAEGRRRDRPAPRGTRVSGGGPYRGRRRVCARCRRRGTDVSTPVLVACSHGTADRQGTAGGFAAGRRRALHLHRPGHRGVRGRARALRRPSRRRARRQRGRRTPSAVRRHSRQRGHRPGPVTVGRGIGVRRPRPGRTAHRRANSRSHAPPSGLPTGHQLSCLVAILQPLSKTRFTRRRDPGSLGHQL